MRKIEIDFNKTGMFSKKFNEFISQHSEEPYFPSYSNISAVSDKINFSKKDRINLRYEVLGQYANLEINKNVKKNIDTISEENTFTVTTGHQLNIFSGPMYIIYKIISVIKLAKELNSRYPDKNFIPVYWMASEDHDLEEIKSFFSNGKTYTWDVGSRGAVGKINPSSLRKLIEIIPDSIDIFNEAYLQSKTLAEAVRRYMNSLFGIYGLVILDPDSKNLKKSIIDLISDDIFNNTIYKVEKSSKKKSEVFIRKINFFYLDDQVRERIESDDSQFMVKGTKIKLSKDEMRDIISLKPHKLSPNVVTRCLYQQMVLPNVAYIGGPSEVLYWLSFKKFFEEYGEIFPVIIPRDSVLILSRKSLKTFDRYGLEIEDIFKGKNYVEKKALGILSDNNKNFSTEISIIKEQFKFIAEKYNHFDATMSPHIIANSKKIEKILKQIENRFIKSQKKYNKTLILKINEVFDKVFPEDIPQERKDNILSYYNSKIIDDLYHHLDPMRLKFKIMV